MSTAVDDNFDGLSSLVRLSGTSIPARARFVGETLLGCTLTSVSVGLLGGSIGATFFMTTVGPVVPFLIGSGVGYSFGLFYHWNLAKTRALTLCKNYPRLMAHSLRWDWDVHDAPLRANGKELAAWVLQGGLPRISNSIMAAVSCSAAAEEIQERHKQRLVDIYVEGETAED